MHRNGIKFSRRVAETTSLGKIIDTEVHPGDSVQVAFTSACPCYGVSCQYPLRRRCRLHAACMFSCHLAIMRRCSYATTVTVV